MKSGNSLSMLYAAIIVAPFAGAWIEISTPLFLLSKRGVAPFAGAWIEIIPITSASTVRVRVAPFAGAWIEILCYYLDRWHLGWSLPSRERGLK